jgi:hypothetical protein
MFCRSGKRDEQAGHTNSIPAFQEIKQSTYANMNLASFELDSTEFEPQRGHLFFGILPLGEISQEGFIRGLVSPPATSRYIGLVRIISKAPLVCPNGC